MAKRASRRKRARTGAAKRGGRAAAKRTRVPRGRRPTRARTAKTSKKRAASRSSRPRAARAGGSRLGLITHTELASADPGATREWCQEVLGWQFGPPMPTPGGPYHMWRFPSGTGGGIRANQPPEVPGSIPYCEVADIQSTFARALERGAIEMLRPEPLPDAMGWIAVVAAPGGVAIGLWAKQ